MGILPLIMGLKARLKMLSKTNVESIRDLFPSCCRFMPYRSRCLISDQRIISFPWGCQLEPGACDSEKRPARITQNAGDILRRTEQGFPEGLPRKGLLPPIQRVISWASSLFFEELLLTFFCPPLFQIS